MPYSFQSVLCLILLILLPSISRANDLPRDLRKIDQLTPLTARDLVEQKKNSPSIKLPNLLNVDKQTGDELAKLEGNLILPPECISTIDSPALLKKLLVQKSVPRLSSELRKNESLCLQTYIFKQLDKETASVLSQQKAALDLSGLESLDKQVAAELAHYKGKLDLSGLTSIDKNLAEEFAQFECNELNLSGLDAVDDDVVQELVKYQGDTLRLDGITEFNKDLAKKTTRFSDYVLRYNFPTIDKDSAQEIAQFKGKTISLGLTSLNKEIAEELIKFQGTQLDLNALQSLDASVAQELAKFDGHINLLGLNAVDLDTVLALRQQAKVYLRERGAMTLEAGVAQEIDSSDTIVHIEDLIFSQFNLIDRTQIREISETRICDSLTIRDFKLIDTSDAKVIAKFQGKTLDFPNLVSINPLTAFELAKFKGDSLLIGLNATALPPTVFRALGNFRGFRIGLNYVSPYPPADNRTAYLAHFEESKKQACMLLRSSGFEGLYGISQEVNPVFFWFDVKTLQRSSRATQ